MKLFQSVILFLLLLLSMGMNAQNAPVDFEENGFGADWSWRTFENFSDPELEISANPDSTSLNPSDSVAKFTALANGAAFAGVETMHGQDIGTFTINPDNAIIRIMVWKSVISDVGIKLVRADNWSLGEIKIANTKVNEWEQLEFNFSSHIGNTYDQLVIFPDFRERSEDEVIYFDNVFGQLGSPSSIVESDFAKIKVFPNPTIDKLNLTLDHEIQKLNSIQILDFQGRLIREYETSLVHDKSLCLDVQYLQFGTYILRILADDQIHSRPIIVK